MMPAPPRQLALALDHAERLTREDFLPGPSNETALAMIDRWPDWTMPAMAAGIFLAGQFIEGNILQPLLVGKEIGLHPVWLMFALIAFGVLFGFVGLLVAVPVAAAIGVLVRFMLRQYLASPYYTGGR